MAATTTQTPERRIKPLPSHLINQIAAGEVVERPASVVKELVENSLDAGSTRIDILLKDGGRSEISIVDNGAGIEPEDLPLALERHATSKLAKACDLESIQTFGFRGEALSSIAAVANVELRSRRKSSQAAHQIRIQFGELQKELPPIASPPGTSITVSDLFEKIPARQKFLKSVATELSHCSRTVRELALGNPEVAFYLHHQGKQIAQYTARTLLGRFEEGFSVDWVPLEINEENAGVELVAALSPTNVIQDRGEVFVFVNGRSVRNRTLFSAVRNAYAEVLGPHHEPSGVLFLNIRWDWVDVNVHPQKLEVRLMKQETFYPWIVSSLRKALSQRPEILEVREPLRTIPVEPQSAHAPNPVALPLFSYEPRGLETPRPSTLEFSRPAPAQAPRPLRYLGQIQASYLVCEDAEGLLLFDQHALHEKLRYEELLKQSESVPQRLLVHKVIRVPSDLIPVLESHADELARIGLELEPMGNGDWAVKTIPDILEESELEAFLMDTLGRYPEANDKSDLDALRNPVLATLACHSVVRAGQALHASEAERLLYQLPNLTMGWTCPHGRPVVFRLNFQNIEKYFKRT